uniref:Tryptophan 2,3-dioxygenase n=1 Tax=Lygus hesperus TaxID=30085 RepID=A0A0A9W9S8_LYGHE
MVPTARSNGSHCKDVDGFAEGALPRAPHISQWLPQSPDLTPCYFFFWGYLKSRVFNNRPQTLEDLRTNIWEGEEEEKSEEVANILVSTLEGVIRSTQIILFSAYDF